MRDERERHGREQEVAQVVVGKGNAFLLRGRVRAYSDDQRRQQQER